MGLPVPTFLSDCSDQAKVVSNRQLSLTSYRKLINMSNSELACVYAALILADDDVTVTGEKIETILKAAGVEVEPYCQDYLQKPSKAATLRISSPMLVLAWELHLQPEEQQQLAVLHLQLKKRSQRRKKSLRNLMTIWDLVFLIKDYPDQRLVLRNDTRFNLNECCQHLFLSK